MKINYNKILRNNMLNVFKEVLLNISENGLQDGNHLYITFDTSNAKVKIPTWLKEKHPEEMTIVIQYEYWDFIIKKKIFNIGLSFNNIKAYLTIPYDSIISFTDPNANFGLRLSNEEKKKKKIKSTIDNIAKKTNIAKKKNNILQFKKISKS